MVNEVIFFVADSILMMVSPFTGGRPFLSKQEANMVAPISNNAEKTRKEGDGGQQYMDTMFNASKDIQLADTFGKMLKKAVELAQTTV